MFLYIIMYHKSSIIVIFNCWHTSSFISKVQIENFDLKSPNLILQSVISFILDSLSRLLHTGKGNIHKTFKLYFHIFSFSCIHVLSILDCVLWNEETLEYGGESHVQEKYVTLKFYLLGWDRQAHFLISNLCDIYI